MNEFLQKHPKILHLKTSAKNREGVEVAFEKIAIASVENRKEEMYRIDDVDLFQWKCQVQN